MKKAICSIRYLITVILFSTVIAAAVNAAALTNEIMISASVNSSHITVRGQLSVKAEEDICLVIPVCNMTAEQYLALKGQEKQAAIRYIRQFKSNSDGSYTDSFDFVSEYGEYTVIVSSGSGIQTKTFVYSPDEVENDVDPLTSTEITPWFTRYHFTSAEQYEKGIKGGEGFQMGYALTYSPHDSNVIFSGTDTNGIWKSTDGGANWANTSSGLGCFGVNSIICDKTAPLKVYAAIGPNSADDTDKVTEATGIYASYDGGATWTLEQKTSFYRTHTPELFAYLGDTLYCASHSGEVYRKLTDGTWELAYTHIYDDTADETKTARINNLANIQGRLVLSAKGGIYYSTDGTSFSASTTDSDIVGQNVIGTVNDPENTAHWYAITSDSLYCSYDSGDSWDILKTADSIHRGCTFGQLKFGGLRQDGNSRMYVTLYGVGGPLFYSDDGGLSFTQMQVTESGFVTGRNGYGCEPFCIDPRNSERVIASFDTEIFVSDDAGATFRSSSGGYSGARVMDMAFNPEDDKDIFFSFVDFGTARSFDSSKGESFPLAQFIHGERYDGTISSSAVERDPFNNERIIMNRGKSANALYLSEDDGETWSVIDAVYGKTMQLVFFNHTTEGVIYAQTTVSYDGGSNWTDVPYHIYAVSPINGDIVYALDKTNNKLLKSNDKGQNWETLLDYIDTGAVQIITADAKTEDKLYIGFYAGGMGIYENSALRRVTASDDGYSMRYIFSVAQNPNYSNHLIAGGVDCVTPAPTAGLFESFDGGKSWKLVKGLPFGRDIWRVFFHPNLPRAYISTSSGLYVYEWQKHVPGDIVLIENKDTAHSFKLYNVTESKLPVSLITAVYDNTKVSLDTVVTEDILLNPLCSYEFETALEPQAGKSVKLFVWKDTASMVPYMAAVDVK